MKTSDIVRRIDELVAMGNNTLSTRRRAEYSGGEYVDSAAIKGFRSASLSFIERIFGEKHPHFREFEANTKSDHPENAETGISILQAIRSEIDGGWLFTLKGMVTAEALDSD